MLREPGDYTDGRPRMLLGARYELINEIGCGAMGTVHRALDRLTGRVVTLKRLRAQHAATGEPLSLGEARLALAAEFRLLASLRHPNIVSVVDYGFDDDRLPFFTMDLEENARTIIEAGQGRPLAVQVDLVVQSLRALAYLHRHGIIHRDLKPTNVLVVDGQVKVLDFGLSVYCDAIEARGGEWAGTLAYMAPEMLRGEPVTQRADLFSLGMIVLELLVGAHPFARDEPIALHQHLVSITLPRPKDEIDERLRPVLTRLLAKQPGDRYEGAAEVIAALASALGRPLSAETVATRESFLQAAPLVGRAEELGRLTAILGDATQGTGSAWLVGGESGVGKSRLLDEIRTRALVEGITVVRGQGRSQAGGPYHVWRDVVSALALRVALGDLEAAVLRAMVPDIERLLGRTVPDAPAVGLEAAQARMLTTVEELFRRQPGAVVVILEDLQWVGSESLKMLSWMAREASSLPLVLLGSYRNDEAPTLPGEIEGAQVLHLRRLGAEEVAALSEAMIGPAAQRPELMQLIERQTEGIPFFIVEVVRALAEHANGLDQIAAARFPERIVSGGMQRVIRRRLGRVPASGLLPLQTAAVAGRAIDPALITTVHPDLAFDQWTNQCSGAAVLELRDQCWRFAHDKLREQLLDDLSASSRAQLHRRVGEALERTHPGCPDVSTALAYHWREAGDTERETRYAYQAALLALEGGACREAAGYAERALALLQVAALPGAVPHPSASRHARAGADGRLDPDSLEFRLGAVEGVLTDAYFRLGDLRSCREHAVRALDHFGYPMPVGKPAFVVAMARQATSLTLRALLAGRRADARGVTPETTVVARVQMRLIDSFFYALEGVPLTWSVLAMLNHCEHAGPSPELARAYVLAGLLAGLARLPRLGNHWHERALEVANRTGAPADLAWVLARVATLRSWQCRWNEATAPAEHALAIAREVGDPRSREENLLLTGRLYLHTAQFERAIEYFREAYESALRSGDFQFRCGATILWATALGRLGRDREALPLYERTLGDLAGIDQLSDRSSWSGVLCMQSVARLRTGDGAGAYESASRALALVVAAQPVGDWMQQGIAAVAEVLLTLLENGWTGPHGSRVALEYQARQAVRAMCRFAGRFPVGRPAALLWSGLLAWTSDHRRLALRRWQRAAEAATRLQTPYELGRAHLEIGRHLPFDAPRRLPHLDAAAVLFQRLGCATDLARVRTELDRGALA